MSQHPSLRSKGKGMKFRSVLKRFERLRDLVLKEKWTADMSVFGLPKTKIIKFKVKKEKAAPAEAAAPAGAEGQLAQPAAQGGAGQAKTPGLSPAKEAKTAAPSSKEAPKKKEQK